MERLLIRPVARSGDEDPVAILTQPRPFATKGACAGRLDDLPLLVAWLTGVWPAGRAFWLRAAPGQMSGLDPDTIRNVAQDPIVELAWLDVRRPERLAGFPPYGDLALSLTARETWPGPWPLLPSEPCREAELDLWELPWEGAFIAHGVWLKDSEWLPRLLTPHPDVRVISEPFTLLDGEAMREMDDASIFPGLGADTS